MPLKSKLPDLDRAVAELELHLKKRVTLQLIYSAASTICLLFQKANQEKSAADILATANG